MSVTRFPAISERKCRQGSHTRFGISDPHQAQQGHALLLLFLTLGFASTLFLTTWNNQRIHLAREQKTEQSLLLAKEALLAYALTYGEFQRTNADPPGITTADDVTLPPGTLPCPESTLSVASEGAQSGNCGVRDQPALGRLPWRSLGTGPLRDGHEECLWYAVSGGFKENPSPHLLNWDSPASFEIRDAQGQLIESDVVAVIISAGTPLAGQDRSPLTGTIQCGGNYTARNYLEPINLNGTTYNNGAIDPAPNGKSVFIAGPVRSLSGEILTNDRLLTITRDDLFSHGIERRTDFVSHLYDPTDTSGDDGGKYGLAQKLAACLAKYGKNNSTPGDKRLPWASRLDITNFDNDSFDDSSGQYAGRPAYRVGSSRTSTRNALVPAGCASTSDNCRLLIAERCLTGWWRVAGQPLDSTGNSRHQSPEGWWDKWKDQFFYAVSPEFAPNSDNNWTDNPDPCTPSSQCISVGARRYAAVVVFAGKVRPGQVRASLAERQNPDNYLDNTNALAFSRPRVAQTRTLTATGNDQLVCITPDLKVDTTCH